MTAGISLRRRLLVTDINNTSVRDITKYIRTGKIAYSEKNAIQWNFDAQLSEDVGLQPWKDFLAPYLEVTLSDGTKYESQCGLYLVVPDKRVYSWADSRISVDGRDMTYLLAQDSYTTTFSVLSSDDVLTKVRQIIVSCGILDSRISLTPRNNQPGKPELPTKLQVGRDFLAGMSKLEIINELLGKIRYTTLGMDNGGMLIAEPEPDLATAGADVEYFSGRDGYITGEIETKPDYSNFANVVIVTSGSPKSQDRPQDNPTPGSLAVGRTVRTTASDGLNLRSGAGTNQAVQSVLPNNTPGSITGGPTTATGYTWWQVSMEVPGIGNRTGWCAANWLTGVTGDPAPASTEKPAIYSIQENKNPDSPLSTLALGRRWVRVISASDIETQAQADEKAKTELQNSLKRATTLTLKTFPDPRRSSHEVYSLNILNRAGKQVATGNWYCEAWELGFTIGEPVMTHTCTRIDPWTRGEPLG